MSVRFPTSGHELYALLQTVFHEAKAAHHYVSDLEKYGVPEDWRPELVGDCDSFALWCRDEITRRYGFSSDLVLCLTEAAEGHLVLHLGGFVLDNRWDTLQTVHSLPRYRWLAIGLPDGTWRRITALSKRNAN